ncbi:MAG: potassium-transporting ATPase subunit KdpA [Acidobacteria bacterium]|nr:potassium-transporting ATPase subunit KdpA [Acidobacteriota bacterium]
MALAWPLGAYMARVYEGRRTFLHPVLAPVERGLYRLCGVSPGTEMSWRAYAGALLSLSLLGGLVVYAVQRLQGVLPLNPAGMGPVPPDLAFNTAASFVSNTNWQSYGGESTLSYLTQMTALTVQNFLSAATGMAVLAALVRGFTRHSARGIGNFWVDLVRSTLYVLLPLSVVLALLLAGQGVVQTLGGPVSVRTLDGSPDLEGKPAGSQTLARGPAASQTAIKLLGTNGGGFFNTNSAHPFENPTPLSNFLQMLAILLIPAGLCHSFGRLAGDTRQGWVLLAAMLFVFLALLGLCVWAESRPHPGLAGLGIDPHRSADNPGGNMEGKEVRFGVVNSALFAVVTASTSCGAVNGMHDSFSPLGGMAPLWLIQLGEVIFGGVGSGLGGMLVFAVIAVFVAGLMVGRTPEYLGKKIGAGEMKMAALIILIPVFLTLAGTAVAVTTPAGLAGPSSPGPHGFTQVLYAFSSAANNNGSAFGGLNANTPFYNILLGLVMLASRFWPIILLLALAGSLAARKKTPAGEGTLPTNGPLFAAWLTAVVVMVGALSFLPAMALGPIVEHLLPR